MRSSFFELQVASSGLHAARMGLDTSGHNIANANTEGYSRQVINQRASRAMALNNGTGMLGTGTEVVSINRMRDQYLDQRYRTQNAAFGEFGVKNSELSALEAVFNEPSDTGISTILNKFYSSLQELSKNPGDMSYRQEVKQKAVQITKYFNHTAASLQNMQRDLDDAVRNKVEEVNTLTKQIATINQQIYNLELQRNPANDLKDQRDVLIDKLSKIVKINVSYRMEGNSEQLNIALENGQTLVRHFNNRELDVKQRSTCDPYVEIPNLNDVVWKDDTTETPVTNMGGELESYLKLRDGNGKDVSFKGIPYYMNRLNVFVQNFAMSFNEGKVLDNKNGNVVVLNLNGGHAQGTDMNGDTGNRVFTSKDLITNQTLSNSDLAVDNNYTKLNALTFSVSDTILNDVRTLAAGRDGSESDNSVILDLINLRRDQRMFTEGEPEDYMKAIFTEIAVDNNYAQRFVTNQEVLLNELQYQKASLSSVDINEEMSNMVKFQHVFNAAAKIISTIDAIYDTTINRLGMVGR